MYKLFILADDLTGALDTGVRFAEQGIPTRVHPFPDLCDSECGGGNDAGGVLVINTDSRHSTASEARERVLALGPIIAQIPYGYKKTDSTLRGHIGAELEAFMDAAGINRLPFIPAYPDLGRTTVAGRQFLQGIPIDKTGMAADPLNPVTQSCIPAIIREESGIPVRPVSLESLVERTEPGTGLPRGGIRRIDAEREILLFDCRTNADLDAIGDVLGSHDLLRYTAGCAGFAGTLMGRLPLSRSGTIDHPLPPLPLLVVSGSPHRVSTEQIRNAASAGLPVEVIASVKLLDPPWLLSEEARALSGKIKGRLRQRRVCILTGSGDLDSESIRNTGRSPGHIARNLAEFTAALMAETGPVNLAVFGGDTLLALMRTLGCDRIRPIREIEPGIVLAETRPGGITMVTKSGAFGRGDSLIRIASALMLPSFSRESIQEADGGPAVCRSRHEIRTKPLRR